MAQELKKEISLVSGISQLSTTLMGTGLFMIPAIATGIAGQYTLWAWLFLFIAVSPIALTFAQLGKQFPSAGGTSHFVRLAFNERLEHAVAWLFVSVIPVGIPAAVVLASGFSSQLLPEPLNMPWIAQSITIILLTIVNLLGTKSSGRLQSLIALSVFALVIALVWKADIGSVDISLPDFDQSQFPAIASALGVMFWCFVGIEAFAHMGEEFKNPQRDFPIAILVGCLIAGVTYYACSVVVYKLGAYGSSEFDNASIPWISEHLFGARFSAVISIVGFFACFASINLYVQSFARMIWAQARQYRSQSRIAKVSRRGVPVNATLAVIITIFISMTLGEVTDLDLAFFLKLANGIFVLVYWLAMLAAYRLLEGKSKLLAAVSLALCSVVIFCLGWAMLYAVIIFLCLSQPWSKHTNEKLA
ncbi:L-methionine/branched-chain amino acid transporter [Vibrio sp. RC27]